MDGSERRTERHRGRETALQLLYQWEVGGIEDKQRDESLGLFWLVHPAPSSRQKFADQLARGTFNALGIIDPLIECQSENWRLSRMAIIDRLIIRMAVYELLEKETPAAVVIDEALELAKTFSGDGSVGFVNGVLDGVHRATREHEEISD
ncbi:MAG: transcription antitermination factor NusB [Vicinamibacterales bacterium]